MSRTSYHLPPEELRGVIGEQGYRYLIELHRHVYGEDQDQLGTLDENNIPPLDAEFLTLTDDTGLNNDHVVTAGTNITVDTDTDAQTATWNVSPQGDGSLLDADLVDGFEACALLAMSQFQG